MKNVSEKDRDSQWFDNYSFPVSSQDLEPVSPEVVTDPIPGTIDWNFLGEPLGGEG